MLLKLLKERPGLATQMSPEGVYPLHEAIKLGKLMVAEILLNHGADVNLLSKKENENSLHLALKLDKMESSNFILKLLKNGANVNATNVFGETSLHYAIKLTHNDDEIITTLMAQGANVNVISYLDRISPLHYACKFRSYKIVTQLTDKGASINNVTNKKETILHFAAESDNDNSLTIKQLSKCRSLLIAKNIYGSSIVHYATWGNAHNLETILEQHPSIVNKKDDYGNTALHYCAKNKTLNFTMAEILKARGIDAYAINKANQMAFNVARQHQSIETSKKLMSMFACNKKPQSPSKAF